MTLDWTNMDQSLGAQCTARNVLFGRDSNRDSEVMQLCLTRSYVTESFHSDTARSEKIDVKQN